VICREHLSKDEILRHIGAAFASFAFRERKVKLLSSLEHLLVGAGYGPLTLISNTSLTMLGCKRFMRPHFREWVCAEKA
jgi:hypothetical protein